MVVIVNALDDSSAFSKAWEATPVVRLASTTWGRLKPNPLEAGTSRMPMALASGMPVL